MKEGESVEAYARDLAATDADLPDCAHCAAPGVAGCVLRWKGVVVR